MPPGGRPRRYVSRVRASQTLVVAAGGALGATCRWALTDAAGATDWPWTLLLINALGSFVLGVAMVHGAAPVRELIRLGVGVGFCGGFTTFSSFAVASVRLVDEGRTAAALGFVGLSVAVASASLVAGMRLRHQAVRR